MNRLKCFHTVIIFLVFSASGLNAQTEKELLAELVQQEQEAVNALVLYPEDVRQLVFVATQYPELLIKIDNIQAHTREMFLSILEHENRNVKEMLWDLSRYPNLIARLVEVDRDCLFTLEEVLRDYAEIIHPRAKAAFNDKIGLLYSINALNNSAELTFQMTLSNYSPETQELFYELKELPEVLSILTEKIRLTILVGDMYQKQPEWIMHKADSLHLEVARKNADQLEDWKKSVEEDPEIQEELAKTGESYESGLEYDDYYGAERERVVHVYYEYHYPFWLGYPTWYTYPRWRSYPSWYYLGFYPSYNYEVCIVGLPSFHFMHWYFYHPYNHIQHSQLSAHFVEHYHSHIRGPRNSISSSVHSWRQLNHNIVTESWLNNDEELSCRFEEYGSFEVDRQEYNRVNKERPQSQIQFLNQKGDHYPELNRFYNVNRELRMKNEDKQSTREGRIVIPRTSKAEPAKSNPKTEHVPKEQTREQKGRPEYDYREGKSEDKKQAPKQIREPKQGQESKQNEMRKKVPKTYEKKGPKKKVPSKSKVIRRKPTLWI